jgi:hypothetical protein
LDASDKQTTTSPPKPIPNCHTADKQPGKISHLLKPSSFIPVLELGVSSYGNCLEGPPAKKPFQPIVFSNGGRKHQAGNLDQSSSSEKFNPGNIPCQDSPIFDVEKLHLLKDSVKSSNQLLTVEILATCALSSFCLFLLYIA